MAILKTLEIPILPNTRIKRFLNFVHNFWSPEKKAGKTLNEIKNQRVTMKKLVAEIKHLKSWVYTYNSTLNDLTNSMKALVWSKDSEHRYILANQIHCESFFGSAGDIDCLKYVVGKTDCEILTEIYKEQKTSNTFSNNCLLSDIYASHEKKMCHFFEAGIISGEPVLLYLIKIPKYSDKGEFIGTLGIGWDITDQSQFVIKQLKRWIFEKKVVKLHHEEGVYSYAVLPSFKKCDIFEHICPHSVSFLA